MTDLPPGYPYQSITAPFGSPFPPYHIPTPTGENAEAVPPRRVCSPALAAPLPSAHLHSRLLDTDIMPQKLEQSKSASFLKQEPDVEQGKLDITPEPLGPLQQSCSPAQVTQDNDDDREPPKPQPQPLPLHVPSPPPQRARGLEIREEEKEEGQIKIEVSAYSCLTAYSEPPTLTEAEPKSKVIKDPDQTHYAECISTDSDRQELSQTCASLDQTTSASCEQEQPDSPVILDAPSPKESLVDPPLYPLPAPTSPLPLVISSEDPMAGMLALLTASEIVHPLSITPPAPTLIPQIESCSTAGPMEMVALEGMALLSQMAQQELENSHKEQGKQFLTDVINSYLYLWTPLILVFSASHPDVTLEGLDCLLEASKQILLEAIEKQSHIDLPRTLDPNRKYSWRQRKEEPVRSRNVWPTIENEPV